MFRFSLALLAAATVAGSALAQTGDAWPSKPIRMIAPFPPASTADVIARVLGQKLGQRLGQQFVVDNRVGASGDIGADAIATATPHASSAGVVTSTPPTITPT